MLALGLGLGLGFKAKIFGLILDLEDQVLGLGLVQCGFVNVTGSNVKIK